MSFSDALPSVLLVLVAALATSELSLRRFRRDAVSEDYTLRYAAAFRALCIGGALAGTLLAGLWAVDGTVAADPPAGYFSDPVNLLGALVGSLPVGILGATVGGFFGFLQGAVLAFPLATALGRFGRGESPEAWRRGSTSSTPGWAAPSAERCRSRNTSPRTCPRSG